MFDHRQRALSGGMAAIYTSRASLSPVLYEGIEPGGRPPPPNRKLPRLSPKASTAPKLMDKHAPAGLRGRISARASLASVDPRAVPRHREEGDPSRSPDHFDRRRSKYLDCLRREIQGAWASRLRHLRQILLPQEGRSDRRRRRYGCSEEATYLASICRQVYLIVRKPTCGASKAMQERVNEHPNIKVAEHTTAEVLGDENRRNRRPAAHLTTKARKPKNRHPLASSWRSGQLSPTRRFSQTNWNSTPKVIKP